MIDSQLIERIRFWRHPVVSYLYYKKVAERTTKLIITLNNCYYWIISCLHSWNLNSQNCKEWTIILGLITNRGCTGAALAALCSWIYLFYFLSISNWMMPHSLYIDHGSSFPIHQARFVILFYLIQFAYILTLKI